MIWKRDDFYMLSLFEMFHVALTSRNGSTGTSLKNSSAHMNHRKDDYLYQLSVGPSHTNSKYSVKPFRHACTLDQGVLLEYWSDEPALVHGSNTIPKLL